MVLRLVRLLVPLVLVPLGGVGTKGTLSARLHPRCPRRSRRWLVPHCRAARARAGAVQREQETGVWREHDGGGGARPCPCPCRSGVR